MSLAKKEGAQKSRSDFWAPFLLQKIKAAGAEGSVLPRRPLPVFDPLIRFRPLICFSKFSSFRIFLSIFQPLQLTDRFSAFTAAAINRPFLSIYRRCRNPMRQQIEFPYFFILAASSRPYRLRKALGPFSTSASARMESASSLSMTITTFASPSESSSTV